MNDSELEDDRPDDAKRPLAQAMELRMLPMVLVRCNLPMLPMDLPMLSMLSMLSKVLTPLSLGGCW